MTANRRNVLAALAVFGGLGMLAAGAAAQTKITIGYTGANTFMGAFVAKDHGFFAKHGLDVTLQRIPVGPSIPGAQMAGSLTVGTLTAPTFLQAVENGIELQIMAGASLQAMNNPTAGVVVKADSGIKAPADFIGKKIGAPGVNGLQDMLFKKWLTMKGVDWKKVTFVDAPFPQMGDMIKGGQLDGALPVEPFLTRIVSTNVGTLLARYQVEVSPSYLESFYTVTKKWAAANPKAVESFRAALKESLDFIAAQPEEAKKTQITYLGLPPAVVATLPLATFTLKVEPAQVAFWVEMCREFGMIKTKLNADELVVK